MRCRHSRPDIVDDIRALSASVSDYPLVDGAARKFPAGAARRLHDVLFAELEGCLTKGTHLTIALPQEFAGVPIGALLRGGTDQERRSLTGLKLPGLFGISAFPLSFRLHIFWQPARCSRARPRPARFLGVGDPAFDTTKLAASAAVRGVVNGRRGAVALQSCPKRQQKSRRWAGCSALAHRTCC